ncbi:hypothetical protein [Clostridium botulinum]|uniref:hypothetical protein n=1 Tax=Clostridium botulinum TaxID=1491 RepID=UPI003DA29E74
MPEPRTFIGAGDIVVMEAPTYTAAIDVFRIVEYYPWCEITFEKNPLPSLKSMDTDRHVIY